MRERECVPVEVEERALSENAGGPVAMRTWLEARKVACTAKAILS